jgi:tryptophan-rich sensory protein
MKRLLPILLFVVLSFIAGYISRLLQGTSMEDWYPMLVKSSLTPSGHVFSLVWGVLYLLMGISAGIIWSMHSLYSWLLTVLFVVQILLNMAWSLFFFGMQSPLSGLVVLIVLFAAVLLYVAGCYTQNKVSACLNIPYLLWLMFAMFLNTYIVIYN